ncbi:MAG: hypothetical protein IJ074_04335 [Clostridia bacterium]|nr:hypothetical protein [Clostridia bacterium]
MALKMETPMMLHSCDRALEQGFDRLKREALRWAFEGYPVGDYYEAALPGRDAFCIRDTCHQCIGAEALGLSSANFNMMKKFARSISPNRDYCGYWEIDRYDRPCPVDYTNDGNFWYNLPANFDLLDAFYRLYKYTGDIRYLTDPDIERFCALTMEQYIARWDRDGDGIPDRIPEEGRRGIASYDEGGMSMHHMKVGGDLVCAQIKAYESDSEICRLTGRNELAEIYHRRGEELKREFLRYWFDAEQGFAFGMGFDGQLRFDPNDPWKTKDVFYRGIATAEQARPILAEMSARMEEPIIELFCHLPESLWRYGMETEAQKALRRAMDPQLYRREYPEASYSAVGAIATGLMGVEPNAALNQVATLSGIGDIEWVALEHINVLDGHISVEHRGHEATLLTNECAHPIVWRARFAGEHLLQQDGREVEMHEEIMRISEQTVSYVDVSIQPKETICVKAV